MISLEYLAGFVDGEGCLNFGTDKTLIFPRLLIVNTNKNILEDIKRQFGGNISTLSRVKSNWKTGYCLRIGWSKAIELIRKLYPFLRIKKSQAELFFLWDELRPDRPGKWDQSLLLKLKESMHKLNKKGK